MANSNESSAPPAPALRRPAPSPINALALLLALVWLALIGWTLSPEVDDFQAYWQAANDLLRFGDPYASTPGVHQAASATGGALHQITYLYPPLLTYLIQPLGMLDRWSAQLVWFSLNIVFLIALSGLCIWLSGSGLARRFWGIVVLATLLAPPTRLSLQLGQVSILLALLLIASFALRRRMAAGAGLLLALASLIKLYPLLLGGYYLLRRTRRVAWWGALGGALILLLTGAVYGGQHYVSYMQKVLLSGYYPYAAEFNVSLLGFWRRLLTTSDYAVPLTNAPTLATALTLSSAASVLALCVWAARAAADDLEERLHFGIWLCTMLLLSPVNGAYNLVILLLPVLTLLGYLERYPDRRIRRWLIIGTLLICWPPAWTNWQPLLYQRTHVGAGLLLLTPNLYGLLLLLGVLVSTARHYKRAGRSQ